MVYNNYANDLTRKLQDYRLYAQGQFFGLASKLLSNYSQLEYFEWTQYTAGNMYDLKRDDIRIKYGPTVISDSPVAGGVMDNQYRCYRDIKELILVVPDHVAAVVFGDEHRIIVSKDGLEIDKIT